MASFSTASFRPATNTAASQSTIFYAASHYEIGRNGLIRALAAGSGLEDHPILNYT